MTSKKIIKNTRDFVNTLRQKKMVLEIEEEVDPCLELAEIQRHVVAQKGPAVLFKNVKGSRFPVVTNLFGSEERIKIAFGEEPEQFIKRAVDTVHNIFPPSLKKIWEVKDLAWQALKIGMKKVTQAPILEQSLPNASLMELPQIKSWPEDGGAFVLLPLVYTQHPLTQKSNLGMYRVQLHNQNQCGMHIQIHRGGGFHYHEAEKLNQPLPVHIYMGGPPALTLSAICPLPEDVPEILIASLLMGERLKKIQRPDLSPLPFLADADFCIVGQIPPKKRLPEGPFGDHYGYYALQHDYPYVDVRHIFHQKDAIYPATVVGRPPQEDHYIACYLQDLLKPLIHLVMPQVKQIWAYEESGVHSLAGAVVKDRYPREALITALRILGEGQLSLSKVLMVTDVDCDVRDFKKFFQVILERIDWQRDLFVISQIAQDTLDYTGPKVNEGSKAIFLGLGAKKRDLPTAFSGTFKYSVFTNPHVFCPGALAVQGPAYQTNDNLLKMLSEEDCLRDWPFVVLLDDAAAATKTSEDFIWHVFTRFEPAADLNARCLTLERFHVQFEPPVVVDCRLKPWYPKVLESDQNVLKKIEPILKKYRL